MCSCSTQTRIQFLELATHRLLFWKSRLSGPEYQFQKTEFAFRWEDEYPERYRFRSKPLSKMESMASDRKLLACGTPHGRLRPILGFGIVWALFPSLLCPAQKVESEGINNLIQTYATSINRADVNLAESIWSDAPEVTFIHPLGEEHGRAQIEEDVYRHLMGDTFSERKLVPKDISVHVYGDAAWSEFQWDFYAKVKKDGSAFHSQGRETQIYRREKGRWQIIHVHYSGLPVSGKLTGF